MKKTISIIAAALLAIPALAQKTDVRAVSPFDKIEVSGAASVSLSKGETASVKVEAMESDLKNIITEVKNNRLIVKTKGEIKHDFNVRVTYTALNQLDVSGASSVKGDNSLNADKLGITASGASTVELALAVKELRSVTNGASSLVLTGTVDHHSAEVSGAAKLKALRLNSSSTTINATGASSAKINVSKKVKAVANGASSIQYAGDPDDADVFSDTASTVKKSNS